MSYSSPTDSRILIQELPNISKIPQLDKAAILFREGKIRVKRTVFEREAFFVVHTYMFNIITISRKKLVPNPDTSEVFGHFNRQGQGYHCCSPADKPSSASVVE